MKTTKTLAGILVLAASTALTATAEAQTCTADADCLAGMLCHSQTVSTCTGGAAVAPCPANTVCDPIKVEPPTCTESTISQCVYRWQLPCNADAECGDGFACQPATSCSGSPPSATGGSRAPQTPSDGAGAATGASSGVGGGSGAADLPAPIPAPDAGAVSAPTCTTSYPGTCRPKVTTCNTDADCPMPWTCVTSTIGIAIPTPAPVDAGVGVPLPPDVPVSTATTTGTTITAKACQAPTTQTIGGDSSDGNHGTGTIALNADAGVSKGTTPTVPPVVAPGNEGAPSTVTKTTTSASTGSGGGCSVGSGEMPKGTIVLLGLGAAIALLRRKRDRT